MDAALKAGVYYSTAEDSRISAVPRADDAAAGVAVLTSDGHAGKTYELGGVPFTFQEFTTSLSNLSGRDISFARVTESGQVAGLVHAGLPQTLENGALSALIGRPTTPLSDAVKALL